MTTRAPRYKFEPITVKEPHRYDVKTFTDSDDFTAYYRQHEEDFKNVSTAVLNRTYKIPGYRISVTARGTDREELILKKDYYSGLGRVPPSSDNGAHDDYAAEIALIKQRLDNIEQFLQRLS